MIALLGKSARHWMRMVTDRIDEELPGGPVLSVAHELLAVRIGRCAYQFARLRSVHTTQGIYCAPLVAAVQHSARKLHNAVVGNPDHYESARIQVSMS